MTRNDNQLLQRLEIKAQATDLPPGSSTNAIHCPWCHQDKSFAVTKTQRGDLLFLCHRASCGEAGYIREKFGIGGPAAQKRKFTPRVFDYPTERLADERLAIVVDRYSLTEMEIRWAGWTYSRYGSALVMPVLSPHRTHRGIATKSLDPTVIPKNLTYKEMDDLWMGWYIRSGNQTKDEEGPYSKVIVVEDPISALKASRIAPSVAIFGTHINHKMVEELTSVSKNVVLCLDPDATTKAYKYAEEFRIYGNFSVIPLSKCDIKNMNEADFGEWGDRLNR